MSRRPKELHPAAIEALRSPSASTNLDFLVIQKALGTDLSEDDKTNIEFMVAYAVTSKQRRLDVTQKEITLFLEEVAASADFLAESIAPSDSNHRGKKLKRHLRITVERSSPRLDTVALAQGLRVLAKKANAEAKRRSARGARKGRPNTNENWRGLIMSLADLFEEKHRRTSLKARISFGTGKPTGLFPQFVLAVFAGVSPSIRPADSAIAALIKPTLAARKQNPSPSCLE